MRLITAISVPGGRLGAFCDYRARSAAPRDARFAKPLSEPEPIADR